MSRDESPKTAPERTESEPQCRQMRELAAQFVAKQQIVKRNQHNPLRQTDENENEKTITNRCDRAKNVQNRGNCKIAFRISMLIT